MLNATVLSVFRRYGFAPFYLEHSRQWRVVCGDYRLYWSVDGWSKRVRYLQYWWGPNRLHQILTCRPVASRWVREFIEVAASRQFRMGDHAVSICWDSQRDMAPSWAVYQPQGDLLIPGEGYASLSLQKTAAPKGSDLHRIINALLRGEDIPECVLLDIVQEEMTYV